MCSRPNDRRGQDPESPNADTDANAGDKNDNEDEDEERKPRTTAAVAVAAAAAHRGRTLAGYRDLYDKIISFLINLTIIKV